MPLSARPWRAALVALLLVIPAGAGQAGTVAAVEFYNAAKDHYFVTAAPQEIEDLDTGVHGGWQRTGVSIPVHDGETPGASPVCRFYLPPARGDSHFFSASPAECADTRARFADFVLESESAFQVLLPDFATGACRTSSVPVWRLWDARVDTNHRYTVDRRIWQRMRDLGWQPEGYGADQVAMCAPPANVIASVDVPVSGRAVVKARAGGNVVAMLEERLASIFADGPDRTLALVQRDGRTTRTYVAPAGWSLVDCAVHPSGEITVVLTTARAVRIVRLADDASVLTDQAFSDAAAPFDPFYPFDPSLRDDDALQPVLMHDAARLAALGESAALVLRTGRNAVVAYRLDLDANGAYVRAWRMLVEPGSSIDGVFLENGSFDTFGQLANHVGLLVDADANGTLAIGVVESPFRSFVFQAHAAYFGEPIAAQAGVLLTRIAGADGRRLGTSVVDTRQLAELHGLRATAHGFVLTGRVRTAVLPDGTGWDAWLARVASDGAVDLYRVVDVDRGDIFFDALMLRDGRYLALGTTGYTQNPGGASISEETAPLLVVLAPDGAVVQRLDLRDGPREDQVRTIVSFDGRWLIGGMRNGPGTHSGDGQPQLIMADGYLSEMPALPSP